MLKHDEVENDPQPCIVWHADVPGAVAATFLLLVGDLLAKTRPTELRLLLPCKMHEFLIIAITVTYTLKIKQ